MWLRDNDIKEYQKSGFLVLDRFFSASVIQEINQELLGIDYVSLKCSARHVAFAKETESGLPFQGLTYLEYISNYIPSSSKLFCSELLGSAQDITGLRSMFFAKSELHIRQPKIEHKIPSHQDNFYFCHENPNSLTAYVMLTEQDRNSGGLGYKPMNGDRELRPHSKSKIEGFSSFEKSSEAKPDDFVYPSVNAGDVILHNTLCFHRADANTTDRPSLALSIRIFDSGYRKSDELENRYMENLEYNRGESFRKI